MSDIIEGWCEPCLFVKSEKLKAGVLCEDCLEKYCKQCALDHAKFRVFRNHQISQLVSDGEYIDMEYFVPVQVSDGRQETQGSQTSCDGHAHRSNYEEEIESSKDVFHEDFKDKEQWTQTDNTNVNGEGSSNDECNPKVTERVTATTGETAPSLMVTSASQGSVVFEDEEGLSARMRAMLKEKEQQKLRIEIEETEREVHNGGLAQSEESEVVVRSSNSCVPHNLGSSNDGSNLMVTEGKTATGGETAPSMMVTSGSDDGAIFEDEVRSLAKLKAVPEEKEQQKLIVIEIKDTEREVNKAGRTRAEKSKVVIHRRISPLPHNPGLSNDECNLQVTERKTASRGDTAPSMMVTSGSNEGAICEDEESCLREQEKEQQQLRIEIEDTERELNYGGHAEMEKNKGCMKNKQRGYISGTDPVKENQEESNSFKVKVTETDLIKRIPDIHKDDIARSIFLFMVNSHGFSLFLNSKKVLTCPFTMIRRFSLEGEKVHIEIGRRCEFGEGALRLFSDQAMDIFYTLKRNSKN